MPSGTFYLSDVTTDGSGTVPWLPTSGTLVSALKTSGTPQAQADSYSGTDAPTDVMGGPIALKQISDDALLTSLMNSTATLNSGSILIRLQGTDRSGYGGDSGKIGAGQVRIYSGAYGDAGTLRNKNDITLPDSSANITLTFGSTDFDNWDANAIVGLLRSGKFGLAALTTITDTGFLCVVQQIQFTLDWTNGTASGGGGAARSVGRSRARALPLGVRARMLVITLLAGAAFAAASGSEKALAAQAPRMREIARSQEPGTRNPGPGTRDPKA